MDESVSENGAADRIESGSPPPMPRWLKASLIVVGVAIVLLLAFVLLSGGEHGPGRHGAMDMPPSSGTATESGRLAIGIA